MDLAKVLEVVKRYEEKFHNMEVKKKKHPRKKWFMGNEAAFSHLAYMLSTVRKKFVKDGEEGKAFRWLGFVQGVLWARGIYTIAELRAHSRTKNK